MTRAQSPIGPLTRVPDPSDEGRTSTPNGSSDLGRCALEELRRDAKGAPFKARPCFWFGIVSYMDRPTIDPALYPHKMQKSRPLWGLALNTAHRKRRRAERPSSRCPP